MDRLQHYIYLYFLMTVVTNGRGVQDAEHGEHHAEPRHAAPGPASRPLQPPRARQEPRTLRQPGNN